jgi:hypothetical protein
MIQAELHSILYWNEPNQDFSAYKPENPTNFSCDIEVVVGHSNSDDETSLLLRLCTPQWLTENHSEEDVIIGKALLIVFDYNYPRILQWLTRYVERCTGETWDEVATRVVYIGW